MSEKLPSRARSDTSVPRRPRAVAISSPGIERSSSSKGTIGFTLLAGPEHLGFAHETRPHRLRHPRRVLRPHPRDGFVLRAPGAEDDARLLPVPSLAAV